MRSLSVVVLSGALVATQCGASPRWASAERCTSANGSCEPPEAVVHSFVACGGDLVGEWGLRDFWAADVGGYFRGCKGVTGGGELVEGNGLITFGRDGSAKAELAGLFHVTARYPKSCLEDQKTCASLGDHGITSRDEGDTCVMSGRLPLDRIQGERAYTVAAGTLILPDTFGDRVIPYCVSGSRLALRVVTPGGAVGVIVLDRR